MPGVGVENWTRALCKSSFFGGTGSHVVQTDLKLSTIMYDIKPGLFLNLGMFLWGFVFVYFLETGSLYVVLAGLELNI